MQQTALLLFAQLVHLDDGRKSDVSNDTLGWRTERVRAAVGEALSLAGLVTQPYGRAFSLPGLDRSPSRWTAVIGVLELDDLVGDPMDRLLLAIKSTCVAVEEAAEDIWFPRFGIRCAIATAPVDGSKADLFVPHVPVEAASALVKDVTLGSVVVTTAVRDLLPGIPFSPLRAMELYGTVVQRWLLLPDQSRTREVPPGVLFKLKPPEEALSLRPDLPFKDPRRGLLGASPYVIDDVAAEDLYADQPSDGPTAAPLSSKKDEEASPYSAEEEAIIEESLRGLGYADVDEEYLQERRDSVAGPHDDVDVEDLSADDRRGFGPAETEAEAAPEPSAERAPSDASPSMASPRYAPSEAASAPYPKLAKIDDRSWWRRIFGGRGPSEPRAPGTRDERVPVVKDDPPEWDGGVVGLDAPVIDLVECSVFAPPAARVGDTVLVQAFAHLIHELEKVERRARVFDPDAQARGTRTLAAPVERGTMLTFDLVVPGCEVDHDAQSLIWLGNARSVQFGVRIPNDALERDVIATLTIARDSVPLGHVKFKLAIGQNVTSEPRLRGDDARHYSLAFISYASKDRGSVVSRLQMLNAVGIRYFADVLDLDPGQRWEQRLFEMIDDADLFLLFWSSAARDSEWVRREVQYALQRKHGSDLVPPEIKPVIIEGPPVPEPWDEVAHLHFSDKLVYLAQRAER